jgi:hypothetical protein
MARRRRLSTVLVEASNGDAHPMKATRLYHWRDSINGYQWSKYPDGE